MSEQKGNQGETALFGVARDVVKMTARIGLNITTIPLSVLPDETRHRTRRAIAELSMVPISVANGISNLATDVVDNVVGESTEGRGESIAERVNTFSNRLSQAAQEFTSTVTGAAQSAAQQTQQAASSTEKKVDEWVESKPAPKASK